MPPKGKENTAPTTPALYSGKNGKRDFTLELQTRNPDKSIFLIIMDQIPLDHLRPISNSTLMKYARVERTWISYFTWLYEDEDKALKTLERDAPLPPMKHVKAMIREVAINGRSGFKGHTGWSYRTALDFVLTIGHMRVRHFTIKMTKEERTNLSNYVSTLAQVDKLLTTMKRTKHTVRESDFIELLAATLSPEYHVANNYIASYLLSFSLPHSQYSQRIQVNAFACLLYLHGLHPGCIVEQQAYIGMDQVLMWKDMEWVISGWEDGVGMKVHIFMTLHWMKNMRLVDSEFLQVTTTTLPRDRLIMCSTIYLRTMAIYNDVFEEDVFALGAEKSRVEALDLPYTLKMKPHALNQPVFTRARKRTEERRLRVVAESIVPKATNVATNTDNFTLTTADKRRKWRAMNHERSGLAEIPRITEPMSMSSISKYFQKAAAILGWLYFVFKALRYAFAAFMLGKLPDALFKHVMGHRVNTILASTEYQPLNRHVDISNLRFGRAEDTRVIEHHSSVSWDRQESTCVPPAMAAVFEHPTMKAHLEPVVEAEKAVFAKFQCLSIEIPEQHMQDPLVQGARDAQCDLMVCYESILTKSQLDPKSSPSAPASSASQHHPRQPQASSSSAPVYSLESEEIKKSVDPMITGDDDDETREKCKALLFQFDPDHPYRGIIESNPVNPSHALFIRQLALLKVDELRIRGSSICMWCNTDENLPLGVRNKNHMDDYSTHVWACEIRHNKGFWLCPICAELVQCADDPKSNYKLSPEELIDVETALEDHRDLCHHTLAVKLGLVKSSEDAMEDDLESDYDSDFGEQRDAHVGPAGDLDSKDTAVAILAKYGAGCMLITCTSEVGNSDCRLRRFFCPICFFGDKATRRKRQKKEGDNDIRFCIFLTKKTLTEHLISHWSSQERSSIGGVKYDNKFKCGFPKCKDLDMMQTGQMITHLHNIHDYRLVECSIKHTHTRSCFELPEEGFMYTADALLCHTKLKAPLPTTNLREFRRSNLRKTQATKIDTAAGNLEKKKRKSKAAEAEESESEVVVVKRKTKGGAKTKGKGRAKAAVVVVEKRQTRSSAKAKGKAKAKDEDEDETEEEDDDDDDEYEDDGDDGDGDDEAEDDDEEEQSGSGPAPGNSSSSSSALSVGDSVLDTTTSFTFSTSTSSSTSTSFSLSRSTSAVVMQTADVVCLSASAVVEPGPSVAVSTNDPGPPLRTCMQEFAVANPDVSAKQILDLMDFFLEQDMDFDSLQHFKRSDIREEMGFIWSMKTYGLWRAHVDKWRLRNDL